MKFATTKDFTENYNVFLAIKWLLYQPDTFSMVKSTPHYKTFVKALMDFAEQANPIQVRELENDFPSFGGYVQILGELKEQLHVLKLQENSE